MFTFTVTHLGPPVTMRIVFLAFISTVHSLLDTVPHSIITDNGTNLSQGAMEEFCQLEHIRLDVSSLAHP